MLQYVSYIRVQTIYTDHIQNNMSGQVSKSLVVVMIKAFFFFLINVIISSMTKFGCWASAKLEHLTISFHISELKVWEVFIHGASLASRAGGVHPSLFQAADVLQLECLLCSQTHGFNSIGEPSILAIDFSQGSSPSSLAVTLSHELHRQHSLSLHHCAELVQLPIT